MANRNSNRQEKWDAQAREAVYLAILAAVGFLCAGMIRRTGAALHREEKRRQTDALRWVGKGEDAIRGIEILRGVYLTLQEMALGIGAHYLIADLVALGNPSSLFVLTLPDLWR